MSELLTSVIAITRLLSDEQRTVRTVVTCLFSASNIDIFKPPITGE